MCETSVVFIRNSLAVPSIAFGKSYYQLPSTQTQQLNRIVMKTYTYNYPKPSVTTDCILLKQTKHTDILLIKRKHDPFIGKWALPGGFVEIDEDLEEGAKRELLEETGIDKIQIKQFKTYGKPGDERFP